jgi:hypothetical protein
MKQAIIISHLFLLGQLLTRISNTKHTEEKIYNPRMRNIIAYESEAIEDLENQGPVMYC